MLDMKYIGLDIWADIELARFCTSRQRLKSLQMPKPNKKHDITIDYHEFNSCNINLLRLPLSVQCTASVQLKARTADAVGGSLAAAEAEKPCQALITTLRRFHLYQGSRSLDAFGWTPWS
eukprot:jgi/Ulvmu1/6412/UM003_0041.1